MSEQLLFLDDRQPEWQKEALESVGFQVRVERLPVGDLVWTSRLGTVGIEDKPLTALLGDHRTGVLDDELRRLRESFAIPCLLVRGWPYPDHLGRLRFATPFDQDRFGDWTHIAYDNLLAGRQLRGILVLHCRAKQEFGNRIASFHAYLERTFSEPVYARPRQYVPWLGPLEGRAAIFYAILDQVRGLRNRRAIAERLAREVSVSEFLRWDAKQLRTRFTKLMAERIEECLARL